MALTMFLSFKDIFIKDKTYIRSGSIYFYERFDKKSRYKDKQNRI